MSHYVIEFEDGRQASYHNGKWYTRIKKRRIALNEQTAEFIKTLPDIEKLVVEEMARRHGLFYRNAPLPEKSQQQRDAHRHAGQRGHRNDLPVTEGGRRLGQRHRSGHRQL